MDFVKDNSEHLNTFCLTAKNNSKKFPSCSNNDIYPNLESAGDNFDGILLDAYGVFWGGNGVGLLPGCRKTMERFVTKGKVIGILSNSTQLVATEIEKFKSNGLVLGAHFHFLITSGEVAKHIFKDGILPFPTPQKKFYVYAANHPKFSSHQHIFNESAFEETDQLQEADFIYISIPHLDGKDQTNPSVFIESIQLLKDSKLPMICANPDRFAHEGNPPQQVVRQGTIAAIYEEIGGEVFYIGKPSEKMYTEAMNKFSNHNIINPQMILMVGDTPETDIRGANNFGIPSALVLETGIFADRIAKQSLEKALKNLPDEDNPTYFIQRMAYDN